MNKKIIIIILSISAMLVYVIRSTLVNNTIRENSIMHTKDARLIDKKFNDSIKNGPSLFSIHDFDQHNYHREISDAVQKNTRKVDVESIRNTVGEFEKPYNTEEERIAVLERLRTGENEFSDIIADVSKNIEKAEHNGSRDEKELSEAREALHEMEKGRGFLKSRIHMVENDR